jgi:hypothetical protein
MRSSPSKTLTLTSYLFPYVHCYQAVTKSCRLSWLTNSALVYEPKSVGEGGKLLGLSHRVKLYTEA